MDLRRTPLEPHLRYGPAYTRVLDSLSLFFFYSCSLTWSLEKLDRSSPTSADECERASLKAKLEVKVYRNELVGVWESTPHRHYTCITFYKFLKLGYWVLHDSVNYDKIQLIGISSRLYNLFKRLKDNSVHEVSVNIEF